ncbi:hypothetical protein BDV39DRAFT_187193 [Aspergillus sergii]|uniref:Uncharacterized protein n=1 Tax=Aspergillus sergii TaxID=1034303 RepID=A0A5N6WJ79_9EURO|nr:hypothetical protein BDV39DRAFT_187193 [Aspergillus sergii]
MNNIHVLYMYRKIEPSGNAGSNPARTFAILFFHFCISDYMVVRWLFPAYSINK